MTLLRKDWRKPLKIAAGALTISFTLLAIIIVASTAWRSFSNQSPQELVTPLTQQLSILAPPPLEPEPVTLMFVGDMMFDRNIRSKAEQAGNYNFILEPMAPLFSQADLIIGNLEGPITNNPSRSQGSIPGSTDNYYFTFSPDILSLLKNYPFALNLGNNHITNFGADGIFQTKQFLAQAEIPYFGQIGKDHQSESVVLTVRKMKLALINYNEFIPGGMQKTLSAIETLKPQADLVIVYPHWGAEYVPTANSVITSQAHAFVDAGANMVIGSHPHVIQNSEIYQGVPIYYSLGNFVFDQYFRPEVMEGMVVTAVIDPVTLKINIAEQLVTLDKSGATFPTP